MGLQDVSQGSTSSTTTDDGPTSLDITTPVATASEFTSVTPRTTSTTLDTPPHSPVGVILGSLPVVAQSPRRVPATHVPGRPRP